MKDFFRPVATLLDDLVHRPLNFLEWLVTDHNGKPSTSRLLMWIWSGFCIWWITLEVHTTHIISRNAVYLVIISLFGPAISIIMKGVSSKDFISILRSAAEGNVQPLTKKAKSLLKPSKEELDGA